MKNPKIIYHISWVFALVSLVCIGFSSWNITNQIGGQTLTGSIKADNVINSSEYIEFNTSRGLGNTGMSTFFCCPIGFTPDYDNDGVGSNNNILSSADRVTAHYKLKIGNCNDLLDKSSDNAIKVECTLVGTNELGALDIFTTIPNVRQVKGEVEYDDMQEDVRITDERTVATQSSVTYSFVISNLDPTSAGEHMLDISFKFEVTPGTSFTNNFYNKLGSSPEFTFYTKISGVTVL